jgi:hypothetical protein
MSVSELLEPDPNEPLALAAFARTAPGAYADHRCLALEFSSRGDRVLGQLVMPDAPSPPLIVLAHGLGSSRNQDGMDTIGARWVREGAAVASIDFALHGERANPKFSERLSQTAASALSGRFERPADEMLWSEFVRQSVLDLRRLVDAVEHLGEVDTHRFVYVGFSLGGMLGAIFCGVDPRPRGAALVIAGSGESGAPLDPNRYVAQISPRPVLMVNASHDETVSREATERLFAAARDPKQIEWYEAGHRTLPGAAMKAVWRFSAPLLERP